jgi:F-type H+-transporting ATPase subunit gamma
MFKLLASKPVQSLVHQSQNNFGAGIKQLRMRMKTIRSIGKITKAMKMVAASKMRVEIQRMEK